MEKSSNILKWVAPSVWPETPICTQNDGFSTRSARLTSIRRGIAATTTVATLFLVTPAHKDLVETTELSADFWGTQRENSKVEHRRDAAVHGFIQQHPSLSSHLPNIIAQIRKVFGDVRILEELSVDEEEGIETLLLRVKTTPADFDLHLASEKRLFSILAKTGVGFDVLKDVTIFFE